MTDYSMIEEAIKEHGKTVQSIADDLDGVRESVQELEQKSVALPGDGGLGTAAKSLSSRLLKLDGFKDYAKGESKEFRATLKGETLFETKNTITSGAGNVLVPKERYAELIGGDTRPLRIRDLLNVHPTSGGSVEFTRESLFVNNADIQETEGDLKAQSDIDFELGEARVVTIAHWIKAAKQVLADAPQLYSYIDERLMYGLLLKEESQFLNGDGTTGQISGLMNQAQVATTVAGDSPADQVRKVMHELEENDFIPGGIIMNHADWLQIELSKDADEQYYLTGLPENRVAPRLWGLPVVRSNTMPAGQFFVADFLEGAAIFDREDPVVIASEHDGDNFTRNLVTILCENRTALAVFKPTALRKATFA